MRNRIKKAIQWLRKEFTIPVLLVLLLFAAAVIFTGIFIWENRHILLLGLPVMLICGWDFWEKMFDMLIHHVPAACRRCNGCLYFYPLVAQYVYQSLCYCAVPLRIVRPEDTTAIKAQPLPSPDGITRFYFRAVKVPGTNPQDFLPEKSFRALLNTELNVLTEGTDMAGKLYVDALYPNSYEVIFSVCLVCTQEGQCYVQQREYADTREPDNIEEPVFDEEF